MNTNEDYISNQIAVYKNSKTLLEFQDKLKVAPINSYAHIHAGGETGADGRRTHSLMSKMKSQQFRLVSVPLALVLPYEKLFSYSFSVVK